MLFQGIHFQGKAHTLQYQPARFFSIDTAYLLGYSQPLVSIHPISEVSITIRSLNSTQIYWYLTMCSILDTGCTVVSKMDLFPAGSSRSTCFSNMAHALQCPSTFNWGSHWTGSSLFPYSYSSYKILQGQMQMSVPL